MASPADTQAEIEVASTISPEVRIAAAQAVLSEGAVQVSEVLRDKRGETLALVKRLLASAGIEEGTNYDPTDDDSADDDSVPTDDDTTDDDSEGLAELTPEDVWLCEFEERFDALPKLHEGISWIDVEKSLRADPESMRKLQAFDEKGHAMNVFGEENGEFIFVSGWNNFAEVSADHRNIAFDPEGQKLAQHYGHKPTGNAVTIIANIMGVKEDEARNYLADEKFHEQLRRVLGVNGLAWLKTNAKERANGGAVCGNRNGVNRFDASDCGDDGSFRVELGVKKV